MPSYLSIIDWPQDLPESEQAQTLSLASGLDLHLCQLAVRRGTPQVIARLEDARADRAVELLRSSGATAFAPRQSDMRAFKPGKIKRLAEALGSKPPMYACEMWRGDPTVLKTQDIALIVHATLRSSERRTQREQGGSYSGAATGFMVGGVVGAAVGGALGSGVSATSSTNSRLSEVLDLHFRDGSCLRIDADKFNFDVLGEARGLTDRENTAKLLARLSQQAPRAIVDKWFPHFNCPPDIVRSHFTSAGSNSTTRTTEAPAFDFYSAWVAAMYKALTA